MRVIFAFVLLSVFSALPSWLSGSGISARYPGFAEAGQPECMNGPESRACWSDGYDVSTDFDAEWPTTGYTKDYELFVTNTTCDPDGHGARVCLLVNNQYPGPTIVANWGDIIRVTVHNNMQHNGTAIHWHGVRMLDANTQDGVNGLTQCPLAPGKTQVFSFQATQYGTSWYHSHHTSQYGDGVLGPIIINGPASADYDEDLGPVLLSDWFYQTSAQVTYVSNELGLQGKGPPPSDNILINGTNKDADGNGEHALITLQPNKKYRMRLVNTAIDNAIRVSIDNHQIQIITADFVPVKPIYVDSVMLGIGQRYDVIIEANSAVGNYWMRAGAEAACLSATNAPNGMGLAIIRYEGAPAEDPKSTTTATSGGCTEPSPIVPYVANDAGNSTAFLQQAQDLDVNFTASGSTTNNHNFVAWTVNQTGINVEWDKPTLSYLIEGNTSYPQAENLVSLATHGIWTYWLIQQAVGPASRVPHPLHLHGHDFLVLGTGDSAFDPKVDPGRLQYQNPPRRDTTFLPANGWVALAFLTDNPGAWLFHCHIAVHISEGLGMQYLETPDMIRLPDASYKQQCADWSDYYATAMYKKDDSGV